MKEGQKVYKSFEGKKVRIITESNYTYNTDCLDVLEDHIKFKDKFSREVVISYSEIKLITEVF